MVNQVLFIKRFNMNEMPSAFRQIIRKARKDHKCCECHGIIQKGEKYRYSSGIWDDPESFKQCEDCYKLIKEINSHIREYDERVYFSGLSEYVFEGNPSTIKRFINIKRKRKGNILPWMMKRIEE